MWAPEGNCGVLSNGEAWRLDHNKAGKDKPDLARNLPRSLRAIFFWHVTADASAGAFPSYSAAG